jgi:hypothetical protein
MRNPIILVSLITVLITAGCIGQQPADTGLHSIEKDGVSYEFTSDIREAIKVPVIGKDSILEALAFAKNVTIVFSDGPDNRLFARSAPEMASKLQHYYTYSFNKVVPISGAEKSNLTQTSGLIIELIGPSGADQTAVSWADSGIRVEGLTNQSFVLASDRLALILLEDALPQGLEASQ